MRRRMQVSCPKFTCLVILETATSPSLGGAQIVDAAPILRRFVGQQWYQLMNWLHKLYGHGGGVYFHDLDEVMAQQIARRVLTNRPRRRVTVGF